MAGGGDGALSLTDIPVPDAAGDGKLEKVGEGLLGGGEGAGEVIENPLLVNSSMVVLVMAGGLDTLSIFGLFFKFSLMTFMIFCKPTLGDKRADSTGRKA